MSALPVEVWLLVFRMLDLATRLRLRQCCHAFNDMVSSSLTSLSTADIPPWARPMSRVMISLATVVQPYLVELDLNCGPCVARKLPVNVCFAFAGCAQLRRLRIGRLAGSGVEGSLPGSGVEGSLAACTLLCDARVWPQLEELDVRGSGLGFFAERFAQARQGLTTLRLGFRQDVRDSRDMAYAMHRHLERVERGGPRLARMSEVLTTCRQLTRFECSGGGQEMTIDAIPVRADVQLTQLILREAVLDELTGPLVVLEELNVRGSRLTPDCGLFRGAHRLRHVNVSCSSCTPDMLAVLLREAPLLETIDLCYARDLTENTAAVASLLVPYLQRSAGRVGMLGLGGFVDFPDDAFVALLRAAPLLQHLGISGCMALSRDTVVHLGRWCPLLHTISARGLSLRDEDWMLVVAQLPKLRHLSLQQSALGEEFLSYVERTFPEHVAE